MLAHKIEPGTKFQSGFQFVKYKISGDTGYYVFIDRRGKIEKFSFRGKYCDGPGFLRKHNNTYIDLKDFDPLLFIGGPWKAMIESGFPAEITSVDGYPDSIEFRALGRTKTARSPEWISYDSKKLLMYREVDHVEGPWTVGHKGKQEKIIYLE